MSDELTGLILAGGLGTRLRPLTLHTPKCLVEICGRPFLDYQLELLSSYGVKRVVLSTGYLGHKIEDYLSSKGTHGVQVDVCHEKELLGTGGSIINSLSHLPEEFFLTYGDSYLLQPVQEVRSAFSKAGKLALATVIRQKSGTSENNCSVKDGMVVDYAKGKPPGTFDYMEYGLLFFKKQAFAGYKKENFATGRVILDLIKKQELSAFETKFLYFEVGSKEGLRRFTNYIKGVGES